MNLTISHTGDVALVHVGEARLMYPLLSDFAGSVAGLLAAGSRKVVIDLGGVNYVDSASIGCLMDLYRQATAAGGTLKLANASEKITALIKITKLSSLFESYPSVEAAVESVKK